MLVIQALRGGLEAEGLPVQSQPGLHSKTPAKTNSKVERGQGD